MPLRGTIETIYGMIVAQAREPRFYRDLAVPDTVDGRFDLLLLHLWLVLRRLRSAADGAELCQALFDHFCDDMDDNLREMGVGDLTVPKRMQAFGEAFYGRSAAYDQALGQTLDPSSDTAADRLSQALCRNILAGRQLEQARLLARYAQAVIAALAELDDEALKGASWRFPMPAALQAGRSPGEET